VNILAILGPWRSPTIYTLETVRSSTTVFQFYAAQNRLGNIGPAAWGLDGSLWNRNLLLDWSWSGYGQKENSIPDPPIVANILDFGAVGDGLFDNSGPIIAAIDSAKAKGGGSVLIPAGRYKVQQRIVISSDNIVLKGEGTNATILYFASPLSTFDNISECHDDRHS